MMKPEHSRGPLAQLILTSKQPVPLPILTYPGAQLTGCSVRDIATDTDAQVRAQAAIHERFRTPVVLSSMDLSIEAEAFGSEVEFSETEVPTVRGRRVMDRAGIESLPMPSVGDGRTRIPLGTVRRLRTLPDGPIVVGGMIGPFSLAGRLFGVSEALLETSGDPELILALVRKASEFLVRYAVAFKDAGAQGLIIAEPAAGLMSPRSVSVFSSPFIRRIVEAVQDGTFDVVHHNCGASLAHLRPTLESTANLFHFGKPMNLGEALAQVPPATLVGGNLDPSEVFHHSTPSYTASRTRELMQITAGHHNFFPSSGCDIPGLSPLENIEAFFAEIR
jgi:uroporphyrinogen decarboxylase